MVKPPSLSLSGRVSSVLCGTRPRSICSAFRYPAHSCPPAKQEAQFFAWKPGFKEVLCALCPLALLSHLADETTSRSFFFFFSYNLNLDFIIRGGNMAAYISVPRDLTRVKSKVLFGLTKRQLGRNRHRSFPLRRIYPLLF